MKDSKIVLHVSQITQILAKPNINACFVTLWGDVEILESSQNSFTKCNKFVDTMKVAK